MAVDVDSFLSRMNIKGVELQKKLGLSSGMLSIYKSGSHNPSYEVLCGMIREGLTAEELFGKELADKLIENENKKNGTVEGSPKRTDTSLFESEEFRQGVLKVLSEQQILEFKMNQSINKLIGEIKK